MFDEEILSEESTSDVETTEVYTVFVLENEDESQKFSQGQLNNLIIDLAFSKDKAELLALCLKEKCLLKDDFISEREKRT